MNRRSAIAHIVLGIFFSSLFVVLFRYTCAAGMQELPQLNSPMDFFGTYLLLLLFGFIAAFWLLLPSRLSLLAGSTKYPPTLA